MHSLKLIVGASASALGLIVAVAGSASANDFTGTYISSTGEVAAHGYWDDSVDTLCVRGYRAYQDWAEVEIIPTNGVGSTFTKRDTTPTDGARACTGNLSIPEDKQYRMVLRYYHNGSNTCLGNVCSKTVGTFYS
jgi:hypothetical protein